MKRKPKLTQKEKDEARKGLYKVIGKFCWLCKAPESRFKRRLCVDHSHLTGRIRGLLCLYCNRYRVGRLDYSWAHRIAEYLKVEEA